MTDQRKALTTRTRVVVSVLVVGHLLAVVLPPLSLQARGPLGLSPSVASALGIVESYSQFLYIDRGYAFFAPDPGPSHLVQAVITDDRGNGRQVMYPNRDQQWPRLLYHRHFMLTEFLQESYRPPGPPKQLFELDPAEAQFWERSRSRYEHIRQSMVNHLSWENPGKKVAIRRIEHLIPDLIEFQRQRTPLTEERYYQILLDRPIEIGSDGADGSGDTLQAPIGEPEAIPAPEDAAEQYAPDSEAGATSAGVEPQVPETSDSVEVESIQNESIQEESDPTQPALDESRAAVAGES